MEPKKQITAEHKAALAEGRSHGRAVRNYLEALDAHRPKRGRRRTPESIRARLTEIDETYGSATSMARLSMAQERINLNEALTAAETVFDLSGLEDEFVAVAATYGDRKGISYVAWREVGVPAAILQRAGISRSS